MKDNFSKQADSYAKYRPHYPMELFEYIMQYVNQFDNAWDCATGNGQTARELSIFFRNVFATDISQNQLDLASRMPNIYYSIQRSDKTNFSSDLFDLVTISQALHWFATGSFFKEVRRVTKNGALIAAWGYSLFHISPEVDEHIKHFYTNTVGPYWDEERRYVDEEYKTIPFPFDEIHTPSFPMKYQWTVEQLQGYINTWSALQKFVADRQFNPTSKFMEEIKSLLPEKFEVIFPLHIRMGRVQK